MFAMSQHQYAYAAAPPPPRQFSGHSTSSAFSSSANPDEDWTKISDLAERRRIQNRIAQRNYRKKLKRRLEDLERRAGTSDSSSETGKTTPSKPAKKAASPKKQQQSTPRPQTVSAPPKPIHHGQFTPPLDAEHDIMFPTQYDSRERSHTPPMFAAMNAYAAYPPPEDMMLAPYGASAHHQYRPMVTETYQDWTTPVPVTLPSMTHFNDAVKREPYDETVSPYMNYGYLPGMDAMNAAPTPYEHSNPHTPPLSHSFDHSANCSEYEYPTTPLSMPSSPDMVQQ